MNLDSPYKGGLELGFGVVLTEAARVETQGQKGKQRTPGQQMCSVRGRGPDPAEGPVPPAPHPDGRSRQREVEG